MKRDKITEYVCSIVLCTVLFFNLFVLNIFSNKHVFAIFMLLYFIIAKMFVKFKKVDSKYKKNIITLMTVFSIIYILVFYVIGIFVGFYRNPITFGVKEIFNRILPVSVIILLSELTRNIFIVRENRVTTVITTTSLVLVDILINISLYKVFNLETILTLVGYVGLSSISVNLLCNYIVKRYGCVPNIIYRIIITTYMYILPIIPDIYIFFQAFFRIIYPYIIYLVIDYAFAIDNFKVALKNQKTNVASLIISLVICISLVLLISCKFRYGIMVVGSSSMTGSISKGDAVVFEQYKNQELEEGQVIIFNKDNVQTIHRIQDIQILNGETIYYTKGDNNHQKDDGYRIEQDIIGVVKFKLVYVGWPTIWVNQIFNK